ncbi:MAG: transposase [Planctomycetota bacterium]
MKDVYGQHWQVETDFSMFKRLLGSALRSRRRHAIDREILLHVATINLMIVWRL